MKKYNSYKDSHIEWIGEVPEHWKITRIGYNSVLTVPQRDKPTDLTGEIPWLRIEDFDGKYVAESKSGQGVSVDTINQMNLKVYPVGTVLTACSCTMGKTAIVSKPLVTNQTFIGITPTKDLHSDFLYFFLLASTQYLNSISTGAIQSYLSRDEFSKLKIPLPELEEQTAIVNFLDRKTLEIDTLIEKKKQLIALLKEERTVIINHAVTRGINPDVKYKDSGIDWIGEIPEHWATTPIRFLGEVVNGSTPSSSIDEFWNGDVNWVTTDDLGKLSSKYIYKSRRTITREGYNSCGTTMAPAGSIVISTRAPIGHIGILTIDSCTNQGCKTIIPAKIDSDYCYYYLLAAKEALQSMGKGSTFKELPTSDLKAFKICHPTLEEQKTIAEFVDTKTTEIDSLIEKVNKEIELMQEYKNALISEVVSGKVDVREEVMDMV